jgi:hypothetical protein
MPKKAADDVSVALTVRDSPEIRADIQKAADADDRSARSRIERALADPLRQQGFLKKYPGRTPARKHHAARANYRLGSPGLCSELGRHRGGAMAWGDLDRRSEPARYWLADRFRRGRFSILLCDRTHSALRPSRKVMEPRERRWSAEDS